MNGVDAVCFLLLELQLCRGSGRDSSSFMRRLPYVEALSI